MLLPLLLGAADRAVRLIEQFVACFIYRRTPDLIEHSMRTLVTQRVIGIALCRATELDPLAEDGA